MYIILIRNNGFAKSRSASNDQANANALNSVNRCAPVEASAGRGTNSAIPNCTFGRCSGTVPLETCSFPLTDKCAGRKPEGTAHLLTIRSTKANR